MKKIEAFIRPEKFEDIRGMLQSIDLSGMTVTQVNGCGNQKGWKEYFRGTELDVNFLPKLKIEIIVKDDKVDAVVEKIMQTARTGEVGDGKIFIMNVENAVRIRTGEHGEDALEKSKK